MAYLRIESITKRFGQFVANDRINLSVSRGTIHALLGENGAGKTTLMNILCGLYQPDAGKIYINNKWVSISSPREAIAQGIGMIHQHFMLIPELSVTENIILGNRFEWCLDLEKKAREIAEIAKIYGFDVDPHAKVGNLPVGVQQRVEILKTLYRNAQLLILDEPTAVLTPQEVNIFGKILRQLAVSGHTIIFISHKLEEVMNLCDTVTVLKQGKVVVTTKIANTNPQELANLMVGRDVSFQFHKINGSRDKIILEVRDLEVQNENNFQRVKDVSFQLHEGEILGIAGVDGNGQRELAEAIAGMLPVSAGKIILQGKEITDWSVPQRIKQLKIGYIPEDRQTQGLVLGFTIARNLILKLFKFLPFCRHWFLQYPIIRSHADAAIEKFDIRATNPDVKVSQLSGGNQQKIILARELSDNPTLIIAMQPTRGLDVGATEYVQHCLIGERNRGAAILYISTELEEIMAMCDRIAIMYEGKFVDTLDANTATVEEIGYLMMGGQISQKSIKIDS